MLPCLCGCASKSVRGLQAASGIRAIREPLSFLYPRWFRTLPERSCCLFEGPVQTDGRRYGSHKTDYQLRSRRGFSNTVHSLRAAENSSEYPYHNVHSRGNYDAPAANNNSAKSKPKEGKTTSSNTFTKHSKLEHAYTDSSPNQKLSSADVRATARKIAAIPDNLSFSGNTKMQLSKHFIEWFTGTSDQNMWLDREGTGCKVYILPAQTTDQSWRHVVLEGSSKSCELTRQKLKAVQSQYQDGFHRPLTKDHHQTHGLYSTIESPQNTRFWHVDTIDLPKTWDKRSLYEYVKTIIEHKPPRAVERILYPEQDNFDAAAAKILSNTFSDSTLRPHLTAATIRLALSFFQYRSQLSPSAGLIWNSAFESGIVPEAEFFNIELNRCFVVNNKSRISFLLYMMERFSIYPNAGTWAFLLKLLPSSQERKGFIKEFLLERLATDHSLCQSVALSLIEQDFATMLGEERGIVRFIQDMQRMLGSAWLTHDTISAMIKQCLAVKSSAKVHEILDVARHSGVDLQQINEAVLFKVIRRTRHLGDIIAFFKLTFTKASPKEQHSQIENLFKVVWKMKLFNICRLLWRYSASHGCITYPMQKLVHDNIAQCAMPSKSIGTSKFNLDCWLAGAIVGTSLDLPDAKVKFPHLRVGSPTRPAELLCVWQPNDARRHEQMQLAHILLQRDLTAFEKYEPMRVTSLFLQLKQAVHRDMRWRKERFVQNSTFKAILQQMIKVGLHARRSVENAALQSNPSTTTDEPAAQPPRSSPTVKIPVRHSSVRKRKLGKLQKDDRFASFFPKSVSQRLSSTSSLTSSV